MEKAQFTEVNEHFEMVFNTAIKNIDRYSKALVVQTTVPAYSRDNKKLQQAADFKTTP